MSAEPFEIPAIPVHLAAYPTIGGLIVPFITLQHRNGKAALGMVDAARMELCLNEHRCGVCAQVMTERMVFLMRRSDLDRGCSVEPGLCPPCAAYTRKACPMVRGDMAYYRESVSPFVGRTCGDPACLCAAWIRPDAASTRLGTPADTWFALWTVQYRLTRDSNGRLTANFRGLHVLAIREIARRS